MAFLRRLLTGGLDLTIALLESLGARGTRWEWRKRGWQQSLEARLAHWENLGRGVSTKLRMCPACRTLVEQGGSTCPACGASLRGVPRGGGWRLASLVLPVPTSVSVIILSANVGMSLLILVIWGAAGEGGPGLLLSPPIEALYLLGGKWFPDIAAGELWRLVTANYLHGGLIHLVFNSIALATLGPLIERAFGWRKFFCLYTLSGVCGFIASSWWHPDILSIGASGAIYGLLGFAVVFGRFRSGPSGRALADQLTRWLLYGLLMFLIPGIDSAAHIGGLVPGVILGFVLDPSEPRTRLGQAWLWLLTLATLVVTIASFVAMAMAYPEHLRQLSGSS
jgi:membrane associated rhomboid family serine protease